MPFESTPILLIGATGMLGRAWRQLLEQRRVEHAAPPRSELDITDTAMIEQALEPRFKVVVNCAGWTDVDGAEANRAAANRLNNAAVADLARRCARTGSLLVHYSSDYVFCGDAGHPYPVDAPTGPINAYGHSKLAGEQAIIQSGCRFLLIRTSWLYGPWGKNFVITISRLARQRPLLKVVADQHGRPTSCTHLARRSLELIERGTAAIYHVTDGGQATWYEFACRIAAGTSCRIEPCESNAYSTPALRPRYSVLDISDVEGSLGPMPHWKGNLAEVLKLLEPAAS